MLPYDLYGYSIACLYTHNNNNNNENNNKNNNETNNDSNK